MTKTVTIQNRFIFTNGEIRDCKNAYSLSKNKIVDKYIGNQINIVSWLAKRDLKESQAV